MTITITPSGLERRFGESEILVSRTDTDGLITYCNGLFRDITGYGNKALVGQPHNCMRHPDMPRSIFRKMWGALEGDQEIFAYVKNLATNGDHYWAFARIRPSHDDFGKITGFEASRRIPNRTVVRSVIEPLYKELRDLEMQFGDNEEGLEASNARLDSMLSEHSLSYRDFVLSL